jgi:hypothetical protein
MKAKPPSPLVRTFAWPAVIAVISAFGLVSALVGDSACDWLSWIALATPVAAIGWAWVRRQ